MTKKRRTKKKECQYHPCGETKNLSECEYCKKLYCPTHITPMIPSYAPFRENAEAINEWRAISNGHPCPQATETLIQEKIRQKENEINTLKGVLDRMNKSGKVVGDLTPIPIPEPKPSLWERIVRWFKG
jgi:hypothetical protein